MRNMRRKIWGPLPWCLCLGWSILEHQQHRPFLKSSYWNKHVSCSRTWIQCLFCRAHTCTWSTVLNCQWGCVVQAHMPLPPDHGYGMVPSAGKTLYKPLYKGSFPQRCRQLATALQRELENLMSMCSPALLHHQGALLLSFLHLGLL